MVGWLRHITFFSLLDKNTKQTLSPRGSIIMANVGVYAIGVTKENVGKMVKTSKARVIWKLAFENEFIPHTVELAHSLVSGKIEISLDSVAVFQCKSFSGTFEHIAVLNTQLLRITVKDTFDGFIYDLACNNVHFPKMPRKTLRELEDLRAGGKVVSLDFSAFTGKSSSLLDKPSPAKQESTTFNPFDDLEDAQFTSAGGKDSADPFGSLGADLGAALPGRKRLVVTQDHLIAPENAQTYADFNILSLPKGALVDLLEGDLQAGLPEPFEDYVQVKTANGKEGKVAKVALASAPTT